MEAAQINPRFRASGCIVKVFNVGCGRCRRLNTPRLNVHRFGFQPLFESARTSFSSDA